MDGTLIIPKSLEEIREAVDKGHSVFHQNSAYQVIKDNLGQYLITHNNGHTIGLTWRDGVTLNGKLEEFLIVELNN
jgi:hypothetical protein